MKKIELTVSNASNTEILGKATLYLNPHLRFRDEAAVCVGNYECTDNEYVALDLLNKVADAAKQEGARWLIGPMNGSTWESYRFSVDNSHPNFLLEPYHPIHYNAQFLKAGFEVIGNYISSLDTQIPFDQPEVMVLEQKFLSMGVRIRPIDMSRFEAELTQLYPLISDSFSHNFLYTPIEWPQFLDKYTQAAGFIRPEYVLLAEDATGHTIGFIFAYEDLLNPANRHLVVKTVARKLERQWAGLGYVLANQLIRNIQGKGFKGVIHAFMHENASSKGLSQNFAGEVYKRYALYGKRL